MKSYPSKTWNGMLILEVLPKEEEEVNGIIIPEMANAELSRGVVRVASEDTKEVFTIGDEVLYPTGTGNGQLIGGKEHVWIHASKIFATL
jgi:co-chaperonin GroES (HSP10)